MNLKIINQDGWEKNVSIAKTVILLGPQAGNDIFLPIKEQFQIIHSGPEKSDIKIFRFNSTSSSEDFFIFRNGESIPVPPLEETELFPGDRILIGNYQIEFEETTIDKPFEPQNLEQQSKRRTNYWIWIALLFILLFAVGYFLQPKIIKFVSDQPTNTLVRGDSAELSWEVSPFVTHLTITSDEETLPVSKTERFRVSPEKTTTYTLTAENRITRILHRPHRAELVLAVNQPESESTLKSEKISKNEYKLEWEVTSTTRMATLIIGENRQELNSDQYHGSQTVKIQEDTPVQLISESEMGKEVKNLVLKAENPQMELVKFIIWIRPSAPKTNTSPVQRIDNSDGSSDEFTAKYAELVPDPSSLTGYKIVRYEFDRQIISGEQIMLEWEVKDAETVLLEPLSDQFVSQKGAQFYFPTQSTNFTLSVSDGSRLKSYTLPISIRTEKNVEAVAPKIDLFDANPVTLTQPGKTTLSWSVSGDWTRIQLIASGASFDSIHADTNHENAIPLTISQNSGSILADYLAPTGFLSLNLKENASFILKAWNGNLSNSSIVNVRVNPSEPPAVLKSPDLKINAIFTDSDNYTVGDTITVSTAFDGLSSIDSIPSGTILISDGLSNCVITLPKNSCDLNLRVAGNRTITAQYSGNASYRSAQTSQNINVIAENKILLDIRPSLFPEKSIYTVGEEITITAGLPDFLSDQPAATGSLFITDGISNCLLTLPKNNCELTIRAAGNQMITVNYSGDEDYYPAQAKISIRAENQIPSATPSPQPTQTPIITPTIEPKNLSLKIAGVYPQKSSYHIGDQIDIYIDPDYDALRSDFPKEKIRISDGYATCLFSVESQNHCSLQLIDPTTTKITAAFPGDGFYLPVTSEPWIIKVEEPPKAKTTTSILNLNPVKDKYQIGDIVRVYAATEPDQSSEIPITGTITVSDSYSSCAILLPDQKFCDLTLSNGLAKEITAIFSGDDIYASSVSSVTPIQISMVEVSAISVQAMQYSDCDHFMPDPNHVIPLKTDTSVVPEEHYFNLDEQFPIGSGFYVNAIVRSKAGHLDTSPGTFNAKICSKEEPDSCVISDTVEAVRNQDDFTQAMGRLEIPPIYRTGKHLLTITFTSDPELYGTETATFSLWNVQRGQLVLTPHSVLEPDPTYENYLWNNLTATEKNSTDYLFDAYLLKGNNLRCPVALQSSLYEKPFGVTLQVEVDPVLPGATITDSEWKAAILSNGYEAAMVDKLQPNSMLWDRNTCRWETNNENWFVHCSDVGISEPSTIRYALDYSDPNYIIPNRQNPADDFSAATIRVAIGKKLAFIHSKELLGALTPNTPYWINYEGSSFSWFASSTACDQEPYQGDYVSNSSIPADKIIHIHLLPLSRLALDSNFKWERIPAEVKIDYTPAENPFAVLSTYHGICGNCSGKPLKKFDYIPNLGCVQTVAGQINLSPEEGTLLAGTACPDGQPKMTGIQSTFCQLEFHTASEVHFSFSGNDDYQPADRQVTLNISGISASSSEQSVRLMSAPSTPNPSSEPQPVTILPTFTDSLGNVVYEHYVGEKYILRLQSSVPLNENIMLIADLPDIFSTDSLDPDQSSCLKSIDFEEHQLRIAGSNFTGENNTFDCEIVFKQPVSPGTIQTISFILENMNEKTNYRMTPFSWSGIPQSVVKKEVSIEATVFNSNETICDNLNPFCGVMYPSESYQLKLKIALPNPPAENQKKVIFHIRWPEGTTIRNENSVPGSNCEIGSDNQTPLEISNPSGETNLETSCVFSLNNLLLGPTNSIRISADSELYQIKATELELPTALSKRNITLIPSLQIRFDPSSDSESIEQIENQRIPRLYRTDLPDPNRQQNDAAAPAFYTLNISVNGIPVEKSPASDETILVQWSLFDQLAAENDLPSCLIPLGDGDYQMTFHSDWTAGCSFRIPMDFPINSAISPLRIQFLSPLYPTETTIPVAPEPFTVETAKAFITVPDKILLSENQQIAADLNPVSAPLSPYTAALIRRLRGDLLGIQWEYKQNLDCGDALNQSKDFLYTCNFNFDRLPSANFESTVQLEVRPTGIEKLLEIQLLSAASGQPQNSFPFLPIEKIPAELTVGPIYSPESPDIPLTSVPVGTNAQIDIGFNENSQPFSIENLIVTLEGTPLETCSMNGNNSVRCTLPTSCSDLSENQTCERDLTITACYQGDEIHGSSQPVSISYRIVRYPINLEPSKNTVFQSDLLQHIEQYNEENGNWLPSSITIGNTTFDSYLVRETLSLSGQSEPAAYPFFVNYSLNGFQSAQPLPENFWLDLTVGKSSGGGITEEIISIPPTSVNPNESEILFSLDFGSNLQNTNGYQPGRQFDEVFEIRKIEVRYAGDTLIAPVSVSYQPEGFEFPIKLISMFEIRLSFQAESLDFGGTTPVPGIDQYTIFCSQPAAPLTCAADPTVPETGCWGNVSLNLSMNPQVSAAPVFAPRCYLGGIRIDNGFDQIWLGDSLNQTFYP
ncbi:MAG TPA: hypothetical protein PKX80_01190 [Flexilinea sp.]|nr:hypothetical protein [Flexilinea sp.]